MANKSSHKRKIHIVKDYDVSTIVFDDTPRGYHFENFTRHLDYYMASESPKPTHHKGGKYRGYFKRQNAFIFNQRSKCNYLEQLDECNFIPRSTGRLSKQYKAQIWDDRFSEKQNNWKDRKVRHQYMWHQNLHP